MDDRTGVRITGVTHHYGPKAALEDVSFRIDRGAFVALLGPNGAGKSTLMGLMARLLPLQAGRIEVLGHDVSRQPQAALARIGIVFQQSTLDLDLTVIQNMRYYAALRGLDGRDARVRCDACLDLMGLSERRRERARTLNGGHRRRLEIARALVHEPPFLLLDEPTVGLDLPTRNALVHHIHALCDEGLAVLWATHLVDEVWQGDGLVLLHKGRVRAAGPVRNILAEHGCATVTETFNQVTAAA